MDERTKRVIREKPHLVRNTSVERIKMELDSILLSPDPPSGMKELAALGLLTEIFPELEGSDGVKGMDLLRVDAFSHYLRFLLCLQQWNGKEGDRELHPEERLILSYAGLFAGMERIRAAGYGRDAKKPVTHISFHQLAYEVMTRMKFSNRFKNLVKKILDYHMKLLKFSRSPMDSRDLRAITHRIGTPMSLVIVFSLLDHRVGSGDALFHGDGRLVQLCHRIKALSEEGVTLSFPVLVTGRDVIRMGYAPGPVVGHILRCVREKQIRGEIGNRKQALTFLRETFAKERVSSGPS
jgi:tRNA nucleotidyltransferase/poly(A) polymerase